MYLVKIPKIVELIYPKATFSIAKDTPTIYITFDDGPIPEITEYVLETLEHYKVKATFFMVGENVKKYPNIFDMVVANGHSIGNHTFNHLNANQYTLEEYISNIELAKAYIDSNLFRPPYGKFNNNLLRKLTELGFKPILWKVLSGDFDLKISNEKCLKNIIDNTRPNDIIVLHDNIKSFEKLKYVLPRILNYYQEKGWNMQPIPFQSIRNKKAM